MVWTTKPPVGTQLDFTNSINDGLVGYWIFNEGSGTVVNDLSGNGNNGTLINMESPPTLTSGWNLNKDGKPCLAFNGDIGHEYISLTNNTVVNFGANDYSIFTTIKPTVLDNNIRNIFSKQSTQTQMTFNINSLNGSSINSAGYLEVWHFSNGVFQRARTTTPPFIPLSTNSSWTTIGYTKIGTSGIFYINGLSVPTTSDIFGTMDTLPSVPLNIGSNSSIFPGYYAGEMDQLCLWNRGMSSNEFLTLNNNPYSMFSVTCPPIICSLNVI